MSGPKISNFHLVILLGVSVIPLTVRQVAAVCKTHKIAVDPLKNLFYSVHNPPIREPIRVGVGAVPERTVKIWSDEQQ